MKEIDAAIEALDWFIGKEMTVGQRYTNEGQQALDALAGLRSLKEQEPVAWVDLQNRADEIVRGKSLWKRFIDGTPLSNDIACWMADFAQEVLKDHPAPEVKQEPVAWMCSKNELMHKGYQRFAATQGGDWNIPVYTHPAPEAKQEPDQRFINLLCRIHRDGGHYIAEHGLDRAAADADILVAELFAMHGDPPAPVTKQEPYDKTEMNAFVQNLYDQKMREGRHGHYETMFHVVHQAIKRAHPAPVAKQGEQEPSARLMTWIGKGTYPEKGYTIARTYKECGKDAYPNDWKEGAPLFTHPAPVNQQLLEALKLASVMLKTGTPEYDERDAIDVIDAAIAAAEGKT